MRLQEALQIMRQLYDLGIPPDYPPLKELSSRLSANIKTGEGWSGKLHMTAYNRIAHVIIPSRQDRAIQLRLEYSRPE